MIVSTFWAGLLPTERTHLRALDTFFSELCILKKRLSTEILKLVRHLTKAILLLDTAINKKVLRRILVYYNYALEVLLMTVCESLLLSHMSAQNLQFIHQLQPILLKMVLSTIHLSLVRKLREEEQPNMLSRLT